MYVLYICLWCQWIAINMLSKQFFTCLITESRLHNNHWPMLIRTTNDNNDITSCAVCIHKIHTEHWCCVYLSTLFNLLTRFYSTQQQQQQQKPLFIQTYHAWPERVRFDSDREWNRFDVKNGKCIFTKCYTLYWVQR